MRHSLAILGIIGLLGSICTGATIIVDSFDEGAFSLNHNGTTTNQTGIAETILNTRRVDGSGLGQWSATMVLGSGFIEYEALEIIPATRPFALFITYSNSNGLFSLSSFNSFRLDFGEVSGSAMLAIFLSSSDVNSLVEIPLSASGVAEYSFANMAASSLDNLSGLTIRISPDSSPFSFSLNEVALVPEPSTLVLAMLGVFTVIRRKR